jgi:hypothetical protein
MPTKNKKIYKIFVKLNENIVELYAKQVYQSDMYGFIEVEEYIFDNNSKIVINPLEEELIREFSEVKRSFFPVQSIVRIDEVERSGSLKVVEFKKNKI